MSIFKPKLKLIQSQAFLCNLKDLTTLWAQYKKCMCILHRQGEFLHDLAAIYESITGIDHWWIGLSDVGEHKNYHCQMCI